MIRIQTVDHLTCLLNLLQKPFVSTDHETLFRKHIFQSKKHLQLSIVIDLVPITAWPLLVCLKKHAFFLEQNLVVKNKICLKNHNVLHAKLSVPLQKIQVVRQTIEVDAWVLGLVLHLVVVLSHVDLTDNQNKVLVLKPMIFLQTRNDRWQSLNTKDAWVDHHKDRFLMSRKTTSRLVHHHALPNWLTDLIHRQYSRWNHRKHVCLAVRCAITEISVSCRTPSQDLLFRHVRKHIWANELSVSHFACELGLLGFTNYVS